jgi:curved DNA-binding protein CbpA
MTCPFRILKLPTTATEHEIIKKWKQLVFQTHPDKHEYSQATEQTKILNDAKDRAIKIYRLNVERREEEIQKEKKNSEDCKTFMSFMEKHEFNLHLAAYGMAKKINELNEETKTTTKNTERMEKLLRDEIESGRKMKESYERQMADMVDKMETERLEAAKQLTELKQSFEEPKKRCDDVSLKKRKATLPETIEEITVKAFVSSHIILCPGHFSTTNDIHKSFMENCDSKTQPVMSDCTFHKILKNIMVDAFAANSCFSYTRARYNCAQIRGYLGVALR